MKCTPREAVNVFCNVRQVQMSEEDRIAMTNLIVEYMDAAVASNEGEINHGKDKALPKIKFKPEAEALKNLRIPEKDDGHDPDYVYDLKLGVDDKNSYRELTRDGLLRVLRDWVCTHSDFTCTVTRAKRPDKLWYVSYEGLVDGKTWCKFEFCTWAETKMEAQDQIDGLSRGGSKRSWHVEPLLDLMNAQGCFAFEVKVEDMIG